MDWISEFITRFGNKPELKDLKSKSFHGNIDINFCNGVPMNVNIKQHFQAETLTKGEKDGRG